MNKKKRKRKRKRKWKMKMVENGPSIVGRLKSGS